MPLVDTSAVLLFGIIPLGTDTQTWVIFPLLFNLRYEMSISNPLCIYFPFYEYLCSS